MENIKTLILACNFCALDESSQWSLHHSKREKENEKLTSSDS